MHRLSRSTVVAFLAAAFATTAAAPAQTNEPIRIGAVLSYSGPSAPLGQPQVNALKLAEEDINAHGGINGRKVVFDIVDDEAKPDVAAQLTTQLIGKNVAAILCGTRVATTDAAARVTAQNNVLQIIMVPSADTWQSRNGVIKTIFQATPRDQLEADAMLKYARAQFKANKIAIVHDENAYGTNGSKIVAERAKTFGMQVVEQQSYAGDATDFTPQILKVRDAKPDAILLWGATNTPALVVRTARSLGVNVPVLSGSGIGSPGFIRVAGDAAKNVFASANLDPKGGNAEQKKLAALYDKTYHEPLVAFAAQAWDAAHIVAAALGNVRGKADGAALAAWLESGRSISGAQGSFKFSASDHNGLDPSDVHVITVRDGKWTSPS